MPSHYRRDLARLKAAIVARTLAGESLRSISADPAMPHVTTMRSWARRDAALAAELAAARRRGEFSRRFVFDEGVAAAFLARARAGAAINSLIGSPGMPSRRTYTYWTRTQGAFAEAVFALRRRRDAGIGARGRARFRAFDQGLADRIVVALNKGLAQGMTLEEVLAADSALPCRRVVARWRREAPEFDQVLRMMFAAWRRRRATDWRVPEAVREAIWEHIVLGGSFASYGRAGGPARGTLRRWYRADAAFAAAVDEACDWRDDNLHDQAVDICMAMTETPGTTLQAMNRAVGPILRHMTRLRHRPGAAHRPRPGGDERTGGAAEPPD